MHVSALTQQCHINLEQNTPNTSLGNQMKWVKFLHLTFGWPWWVTVTVVITSWKLFSTNITSSLVNCSIEFGIWEHVLIDRESPEPDISVSLSFTHNRVSLFEFCRLGYSLKAHIFPEYPRQQSNKL